MEKRNQYFTIFSYEDNEKIAECSTMEFIHGLLDSINENVSLYDCKDLKISTGYRKKAKYAEFIYDKEDKLYKYKDVFRGDWK